MSDCDVVWNVTSSSEVWKFPKASERILWGEIILKNIQ